jgi:glycosyltransferase involved in cell wall biosynthesis
MKMRSRERERPRPLIAIGLDETQLARIGPVAGESAESLNREGMFSGGPVMCVASDIFDIARCAAMEGVRLLSYEKRGGLYEASFSKGEEADPRALFRLFSDLYEKASESEKELSVRQFEIGALESLVEEYEEDLRRADAEIYQKNRELRAQSRLFAVRAFRWLRRVEALRSIASAFRRLKRRAAKVRQPRLAREAVRGVSVVIPTYRNLEGLQGAVSSVLAQTFGKGKIECLVVTNGPDDGYFLKVRSLYAGEGAVRVLHTPVQSAGAARNLGVREAGKDFLLFLDDDDTLSTGYIEYLASLQRKKSNIVCGKLADFQAGSVSSDTYVNKAISDLGEGPCDDYFACSSLLSSFSAKLFRTSWFQGLKPIGESYAHTEDVLFWAENFHRLEGWLCISSHRSPHAYIRHLSEGSLSRPGEEGRFEFFVSGRLDVIRELTKIVFSEDFSLASKRFAMQKMESQARLMKSEMDKMEPALLARAQEAVAGEREAILNHSSFGTAEGVAFLHNFPPYADPSAYVAARRLTQISADYGQEIRCDVYAADMSHSRKADPDYDFFYARGAYDRRFTVGGRSFFNEKAQARWAMRAFGAARKRPAGVIYSRSMWAGSHLAAYRYKLIHPEAVWYAEFSDPISYDTNGRRRPLSGAYPPTDPLSGFWEYIEGIVYEKADRILFTNENQREYMLGYCPSPPLAERARARSAVLAHPSIDPRYARLAASGYELEEGKVHIGYFGSWYANRAYSDIEAFAQNPNVLFHVFASSAGPGAWTAPPNVRVNPASGYFEFLNLASRMDWLFLNDIDFAGPINPYLPSKLSDYLASGTPIVALVREGSPLSSLSFPSMVKVGSLTPEFVQSLASKGEKKRP